MIGRLLLPLCFFLRIGLTTRQLALAAPASSSKVVTTLPGFDGLLPFNLETGYVEVDKFNGTELFYYFVESEAGGENDPVLLWLTGGDHCSVLSGLALEIGPFQFVLEPYNGTVPSLQLNPYSWIKLANILFVDTPVGAGFSFSRQPQGYDVGEVSTSLQLHEFLIKTIMGHCKGEDYKNPINALCAQSLDKFNSLLSEVRLAHILLDNCGLASTRPDTEMEDSAGAGRKILSEEDGTEAGKRPRHPPPSPTVNCETYGTYLSYFWANEESTRDALGIKDGTVEEWVRCHSGEVPYARDIGSSLKYHRKVTANGYRALVYSGDHDAVVPFTGTQAWVRSLGFPIVDDWRAWHLHGQFTITYSNNMTFATVKGAGHTAPEFEPERCFAMFSRWILNQQL